MDGRSSSCQFLNVRILVEAQPLCGQVGCGVSLLLPCIK